MAKLKSEDEVELDAEEQGDDKDSEVENFFKMADNDDEDPDEDLDDEAIEEIVEEEKIEVEKKEWLAGLIFLAAIVLVLFFFALSYMALFYPEKFQWFSSTANSVQQPIRDVQCFLFKKNCLPTDEAANQGNKKCPDCMQRLIDGVEVAAGMENLFPTAVMIDNQSEARPQFGLASANLVYEAEAEGGITRYLAVFANKEDISKIGPVRSARPYFADWVRELSALYVHVGGSPEALNKITTDHIFDLDQFYNSKYFTRDQSKQAPHNVYTSNDNLNQYLKSKNYTAGTFFPWKFKEETALKDRPAAATIKIGFRSPEFAVRWEYDKVSNSYIRYLADQKHLDGGREIKAKNIVIQYSKVANIDSEKRLELETVGTDRAILCTDGVCQEGAWKKDKKQTRTRFYKSDGTEFEFNSGPTWVEVALVGYDIKY